VEGDLAGRHVLDVGSGTGRVAAELARRGCRVQGVDPEPAMVAQAASAGGGAFTVAGGEALPFEDASFERALLRLVVHLVDRPRAFRELARVLAPGGCAVVATFAPEHFRSLWLNPYFPSLRTLDAERFAAPDVLAAELLAAGFAAVRIRRVSQRRTAARADALERIRARFISTLALLPPADFEAGLARAERDLPEEVSYALEWAVLVAETAQA
jgi:SAM-dependent methyltransferase